MTTTEYLESLGTDDCKRLVCMLHEIRSKYEFHQHYELFLKLIRNIDADYHRLK